MNRHLKPTTAPADTGLSAVASAASADLPEAAAGQRTPVALRSPDEVMRLNRLGSFHQSRLSFLRALIRRLGDERWQFSRPVWSVDEQGVGVAVYEARGPHRTYSLIAFANDLDDAKRSDRVVATEWDACFVLFDGQPTRADLARLRVQVPRQEAGRLSRSELSLARANRSVRLFNQVRQLLAQGQQPSASQLDETGYLMRTTAVYGSGKFGALDRRFLADRPELAAPFQVEMLTVTLIRQFSFDIVEHLARADSPAGAVPLDDHLKRGLGIGNATGLGMAPFLINHPALLNNWVLARETALARVRSLPAATPQAAACFSDILERARLCAASWQTDHRDQQDRVKHYRADLKRLAQWINNTRPFAGRSPWNTIYEWSRKNLSQEGQEGCVTLLLEPHADLVDDLVETMGADESRDLAVDGTMTIGQLTELIERHYLRALQTDFEGHEGNARFWYVSEEKLEPRLGERRVDAGAERESPLATNRDAASLYRLCQSRPNGEPVASLMLEQPESRHIVRRVQMLERYPYAEIHDNLISASLRPIDMLRCKLSFLGANRFDPRSDRWVRITLARHAPLLHELTGAPDDWIYPARS
ncbi:MAG: hypothetical protein ACRBC3_16120 [Burkholderiaceae bacterium]